MLVRVDERSASGTWKRKKNNDNKNVINTTFLTKTITLAEIMQQLKKAKKADEPNRADDSTTAVLVNIHPRIVFTRVHCLSAPFLSTKISTFFFHSSLILLSSILFAFFFPSQRFVF